MLNYKLLFLCNNYTIRYLVISKVSLILVWNTSQYYILSVIYKDACLFIPRSSGKVQKVIQWLSRFGNSHSSRQSKCSVILIHPCVFFFQKSCGKHYGRFSQELDSSGRKDNRYLADSISMADFLSVITMNKIPQIGPNPLLLHNLN